SDIVTVYSAECGLAHEIGGIKLESVKQTRHRFTGEGAQGHPVVAPLFAGIATVFCFQVEAGIGCRNTACAGGVEANEFVGAVTLPVGQSPVRELLRGRPEFVAGDGDLLGFRRSVIDAVDGYWFGHGGYPCSLSPAVNLSQTR